MFGEEGRGFVGEEVELECRVGDLGDFLRLSDDAFDPGLVQVFLECGGKARIVDGVAGGQVGGERDIFGDVEDVVGGVL